MTHVWMLDDWMKNKTLNDGEMKRGISFRFDSTIHEELRRQCLGFSNYLRTEYFFPLKITVYIKDKRKVRASDGDFCEGIFASKSDDFSKEPCIYIAGGKYSEKKTQEEKDNELAWILWTIAHELTHYFQWINDLPLTEIGMERQANKYGYFLFDEYNEYKNNPHKNKNVWKSDRWYKNEILRREETKEGLRFRLDPHIDSKIKADCRELLKYLRREYYFPLQLQIKIIDKEHFVMPDGNIGQEYLCKGKKEFLDTPQLVVAAGCNMKPTDFQHDEAGRSLDIMYSIARGITYYFQWINDYKLTPIGAKRQANRYAKAIIKAFISE